VQLRRLTLPDPDPWMAALAARSPWLVERLPYGDGELEVRAELDAFPVDLRGPLADALDAQAREVGAGPASRQAIERLRDPRALVVVTGQQAGTLVGPNFTLLKAAGTVAFARRAEARLQRPVVPVFWTATEDHDVGEIQRVRLPLQGGGVSDFHLFQPVPTGRRPVGPMEAGGELRRLLAEVRQSTAMPGAHRDAVIDLCEALIDAHSTVGGHFMATMARLFEDTPLVFLDPMDPALRRIARRVLVGALSDPAPVAAAAAAGVRALERSGQGVQMAWQEGETGIFAILQGERRMLEVRGGDLVPRGRPEDAAPAERWAERAERTPEAFSTAAHLRPVLQGALMPVLGTVLGPGELRYHAQLKEMFEAFQVPLPIVWARPRAVLVGGTQRRLLERLELTVEDVLAGWQDRLREVLAARDTVGIGPTFENFQTAVAAAHGELMARVAPLGRDLPGLGEKNLKKILDEAQWLRAKTEQAHRQGNETLIRQYRTLGEHLAPEHMPQDRYLTAAAFLSQYGLGLAAALAADDGLCESGLLAADVVDEGAVVARG
jgi:bacillithiol synthase